MDSQSSFYMRQLIGDSSSDAEVLLGVSMEQETSRISTSTGTSGHHDAETLVHAEKMKENDGQPTQGDTLGSVASNKMRLSSLIRVLRSSAGQQPCVFPLLPDDDSPSLFDDANASIDDILKSPSSLLTNGNFDTIQGIIVVTPYAIGKHVSAHVTLETAKRVSKVAMHLGTEDWLRSYRQFDCVEWNTEQDEKLNRMARDFAVLSNHGVVLSMGKGTTVLMGKFLLPAYNALALPEENVCTLSLLEVDGDSSLRDLLSKSGDDKLLRIHHPDHHGGIVLNLEQAFVKDIDHLQRLLQHAGPAKGHTVATLTIWPDAWSQEMNIWSKCRLIQFVRLANASSEDLTMRQKTVIRQSISAIGAVLRHIVTDTASLCSYRDTTLTKVLQRSMQAASIAIVGTIGSDVDAHETTLHTLDFISRLFGKVAIAEVTSPFKTGDSLAMSGTIPQDLGKHKAFFESVVSDPRQRIAKLTQKVVQPPAPNRVSVQEREDDEETPPYQPTNYLDLDPFDFQSSYYKGDDEVEEKKMDLSGQELFSPLRKFETTSLEYSEEAQGPSLLQEEYSASDEGDDDHFVDVDGHRVDTSPKNGWNQQSLEELEILQQLDEHNGIEASDDLDSSIPDERVEDAFQQQEQSLDMDEGINKEFSYEYYSIEHGTSEDASPQPRSLSRELQKTDETGVAPKAKLTLAVLSAGPEDEGSAGLPQRTITVQRVRPSAVREDSRISVLTSDTEEADGPLVTTPSHLHDFPKSFAEKNLSSKYSNLTPPRPREISFATNGSVPPSANQSDSFTQDLLILQGAVNELRDRDISGWQQKARALERLDLHLHNQTLASQQFEDDKQQLEAELKHITSDRELRLKQQQLSFDELKQNLCKELGEANEQNLNLQSVAEQAVSSSEEMQQELSRLSAQLKRTELESEGRLEDYHRVLQAKELLYEELKEIRSKANTLSLEQSEAEAIVVDLEGKVRILTAERDRLKELREKEGREFHELRLEASTLSDIQAQLRLKTAEVDRLKQSNQELSARINEKEKSMNENTESLEAEVINLKFKIDAQNMELSSAKRRLEEEQVNSARFREDVKEGYAALQEKNKQLQLERDRLQDLHDKEMSELEALKVEAAMRADVEKRLKFASSEVERLRTERNKAHEDLATLRSEAFQRDDENENSVQQLRLELHQCKIELRSVNRRLKQAEDERQRIQNLYDEETERSTDRFSLLGSEIGRLQSDLAAALQLQEDVEHQASTLKASLGSREEEISALRTRIKAVISEQAEAQEENRRLSESLHELRENARIQVMKIAEKRRESDTMLESEKERRQALESENYRLKESLEILQREQIASKEGLNSFREEFDRMMKEKSEASAKVARLEKELKTYEIKVEDLEHELQLSKLQSNDDLLLKTKEEYRTLQASKSQLETQMKSIALEKKELLNHYEAVKQQNENDVQAKAKLETKLTWLQKVMDQKDQTIRELEHKLERASKQFDSNDDALRRSQEDLHIHEQREAEMKKTIEYLSHERDDLRFRWHKQNAEAEKEKQKQDELMEQISVFRSKLQISEHTREELIQELENTQKKGHLESNSLTEQLETARREASSLRLELERAKELERIHSSKLEQAIQEAHIMERSLKTASELSTNQSDSHSKELQSSQHEVSKLRQQLENERQIASSQYDSLDVARQESMKLLSEWERRFELERSKSDSHLRDLEQAREELKELRQTISKMSETEQVESKHHWRGSDFVQRQEDQIRALESELQRVRRVDGPTLAELREEQQRREEASQLVAVMARRAKASMEQRDKLIRKLKSQLIHVSEQKEAEIQTLRARLHDWERSMVRDDENWGLDKDTY